MRNVIQYFVRFKKFVGRKIYYLLFIVIIAGIAEGIGVTLFLPILQEGFGEDNLSKIIRFFFESFGIEYSFLLMLAGIADFFALRTIFLIGYARFFGKVSANLVIALRCSILDKVFKADYLYILKKEVGYINNALVREVSGMVDAFTKLSSILNFFLTGFIIRPVKNECAKEDWFINGVDIRRLDSWKIDEICSDAN